MYLDEINEQIAYYENLISELENDFYNVDSDIERMECLKSQYDILINTFYDMEDNLILKR